MMTELITENWTEATPSLSILVPYYHDDPCGLLTAISALPVNAKQVEIIAYDDGTADDQLTSSIAQCLAALRLPVKIIIAAQNKGRSAARNVLQNSARADWLLFLDADMRPIKADFLQVYLDLIAQDNTDVIFGGFQVEAEAQDADRDLHRAFSETSDCLTLQDRIEAGPQYVATSNLCLRKLAMEAEPFDDGFSGWGWEDSEWAARISQSYRLMHVDNPAMHLGLETTDTLLSRFKTSGANYVRFTEKHPELAKGLALHKAARGLKKLPGQKAMRPALKAIVKAKFAPIKMRLIALKLWRASWYAEAMS